jgi:hypothetical protein
MADWTLEKVRIHTTSYATFLSYDNLSSVRDTKVIFYVHNTLEPERSVLIAEYRGVHILQVYNVHKSMEEKLQPSPNVLSIQVSWFASVLHGRQSLWFHCILNMYIKHTHLIKTHSKHIKRHKLMQKYVIVSQFVHRKWNATINEQKNQWPRNNLTTFHSAALLQTSLLVTLLLEHVAQLHVDP